MTNYFEMTRKLKYKKRNREISDHCWLVSEIRVVVKKIKRKSTGTAEWSQFYTDELCDADAGEWKMEWQWSCNCGD